MFGKAGKHFHLPGEQSFLFRGLGIPGGNFLWALRKFCILRNDSQCFLPGERFFPELVPTLVELSLVLFNKFFRSMVRRMRSSRGKINIEWLVGSERLL